MSLFFGERLETASRISFVRQCLAKLRESKEAVRSEGSDDKACPLKKDMITLSSIKGSAAVKVDRFRAFAWKMLCPSRMGMNRICRSTEMPLGEA